MGVRGPMPKQDAIQPRSKSEGLTWVDLPPEGRQGPIPYLAPSPFNNGEWSAEARDRWNRLWRSPQATLWDVDRPDDVWRYVMLFEQGMIFEFNGPVNTALNQLSDKLGLNPYAMRRMYWRYKPSDDAVTMDHLAPVKSIGNKKEREELR